MSHKGENKKQKAISSSTTVGIKRKQFVWTVRVKAGAYKSTECIALGIIVRDLLKVASVMREAKKIIKLGHIKVNGVAKRDHQCGVGLFDVISVPEQKLNYRVWVDTKGRFVLKELEKEGKDKLCKVTSIKTIKGGKILAVTNDGRVFVNSGAKVGDTIHITFPDGKLKEIFRFEKGASALILKGEHASEIAKVNEVISATQRREKLVKLTGKNGDFETVFTNIFIVGAEFKQN
jgi:ribosomal protein S4E